MKTMLLIVSFSLIGLTTFAQDYDWGILGSNTSNNAIFTNNGERETLKDESNQSFNFFKDTDRAIEIMEKRGWIYVEWCALPATSSFILMKRPKEKTSNDSQ